MKSTILLFVTACIMISSGISSQVCTGDFIFETQAAVDQFLIDNPTCTTIDGDVDIRWGNIADPVLDLEGLQNITTIDGVLTITDWFVGPVGSLSALVNLTTVDVLYLYTPGTDTNLTGLQNLQFVNDLYIEAMNITDWHAFDNITTLTSLTMNFGGYPIPDEAPDLINVFPSLVEVANYLTLGHDLSVCDSITGFNNLIHVGHLEIGRDLLFMNHFDGMHNLQTTDSFYNYGWSVESVSGFESLESISYVEMAINCSCDLPDFESLNQVDDMWLFNRCNTQPDFPSLTEISNGLNVLGASNSLGFVSLESVVGDLYISAEPLNDEYVLDEIHLDSLRLVGGNLGISATNITNLDFLSHLESVGEFFYLEGNANLTECEIVFLCEQLPITPEFFTINNGPGCGSPEEVLASCGESYVAGLVYYDLDCDGIFNNGDTPVSNPILVNELNQPVSGSNAAGQYFIPLADNSVSTFSVAGMPSFTSTPAVITTDNSTAAYDNIDFPLCPTVNLHDVGVSAQLGTSFRPGQTSYVVLYVHNYSMYTEDVQVVLHKENMPGVSNYLIYNSGVAVGDSMVWLLEDVPPFSMRWVSVQLYVAPSTPLGQVLEYSVSAMIQPNTIEDIDPGNNSGNYSQIVVGSYDPNDITVNLPAYDYDILELEESIFLDYTIRFQNTGTADAINIRVTNFIEDDLDLSSFQLIQTSHPATLTFNENNEVEWLFENIMLPYSTSNEEASHGFIQYRIKTKPSLLLTDIIENSAAIYFDFNEPVITNTATTIFYECTQVAEIIGVADVCEGQSMVLASSGNWNQFVWTFDGEVVGSSNQVEMTNLTSGQHSMSLLATDTFCEDVDDFEFAVEPIPDAPIITQLGNTLVASGNGIFTWTLNGDMLSDFDNTIEITQSGIYAVSSMVTNCMSEVTSGSFELVGLDENTSSLALHCFPNPADDCMSIQMPQTWLGLNDISLVDLSGRIVLSRTSSKNNFTLELAAMAPGVYQLIVENKKMAMVLTEQLFVK